MLVISKRLCGIVEPFLQHSLLFVRILNFPSRHGRLEVVLEEQLLEAKLWEAVSLWAKVIHRSKSLGQIMQRKLALNNCCYSFHYQTIVIHSTQKNTVNVFFPLEQKFKNNLWWIRWCVWDQNYYWWKIKFNSWVFRLIIFQAFYKV